MQAAAFGENIFASYEKFRDSFDSHFTPPKKPPIAYTETISSPGYAYIKEVEGEVFEPSSFYGRGDMYCAKKLPGKFVFKATHHLGMGRKVESNTAEVYHTLNTVRQTIFRALGEGKNSVVVPWYEENQDAYVFEETEQTKSELDADQLVARRVSQEIFGGVEGENLIRPSSELNHDRYFCKCRTGLSARFWQNLILPVLSKMLKSAGCEVLVEKLAERKVTFEKNPCWDPTGLKITEKQVALDALKIAWKPELIPNYPLPMPKTLSPPPEPTPSVVGAKIMQAYEKEDLCDFEFVCSDGSCKAHKFILILQSEFFKGMLMTKTPLKELREGQLVLREYPVETIKAMLNYMYKEINPFAKTDSKVNPYQIFLLSHRWDLSGLVDMAANEIGEVCMPEEWREIGELGAVAENAHLLKIYDSLRKRMRPIPEPAIPIKNAMIKLGLLEKNNT